jgi:hypothetical protein
MPTVTASNNIVFTFGETITYGIGSSSQNLAVNLTFRSVYTVAGILLNQCNLIYAATIALAASTPVVLDLQTLTDLVGAAAAFARVRLIAIRNNSQLDGDLLLIGADGTDDWVGLNSAAATGTIPIYPSTTINDGFAIFQMPSSTGAVVGSTNCNVKLNPGSNAKTVDILIAGCNT